MADENTQVRLTWADLPDDYEAFERTTNRGDNSPLVKVQPETKQESSPSPSKRWKRDCLSPKHTAALESGRSQDDASPTKKKPATAE